MKKTEQRWMNERTGIFLYRGEEPDEGCKEGYVLGTFSWDEPEWEEVEVVRWECKKCGYITTEKHEKCSRICRFDEVCGGTDFIELKGIDRRRKSEVEEVWEGRFVRADNDGDAVLYLPKEWIGKKVEVRVI